MDKGKVVEARRFESISGAAEGTIGFGKGVMRGTNDSQFLEFDGTQGVDIRGLALFTLAGNIDDGEFVAEQPMRVLRKGVMMAEVSADAESTIDAGDKVAIDGNGDVTSETEAIVRSSGSNYAAVIEDSEFVEGGSSGDKVKIEINFPCDVTFEDLSVDNS